MALKLISWRFLLMCIFTLGDVASARLSAQSSIAPVVTGGVAAKAWMVNGEYRRAIVSLPLKLSEKAPLVFVYHGHGGTAKRMASKGFRRHWPEAIFVYPQGLPTPTKNDPMGKRSGWQNRSGVQGDRDLHFFDSMISSLMKEHSVDDRRIYVTGHSNGGGMTGLLWAMRRDRFAGVAISAGGVGEAASLQPLPVLMLSGRKDTVVPFANQQRSIEWFQKVNRAAAKGEPMKHVGLRYPSELDCAVATYVHDGGHEFLEDAPKRITAFFRTLRRPVEGYQANDEIRKEDGAGREARFDQLDSDRDGRISPSELPRRLLFRRLDRDGDGFITRAEAKAAAE